MSDAPTVFWRLSAGVIALFMISPLLILILFAFSDKSLLAFPIPGLTIDWFTKLLATPQFWAAFQNSLVITATVGAVSTVIGTMAATALVRLRPRVSSLTMALLTLPVMLPPLVLGVSLLTYYTSVGVGLGLPMVILSHLVFTQPLVILIVYARLANFDDAVVDSARDLGASPLQAFFTVTLPIIRPTLIGAALIAMALSLDDFLITFFTIGGGNTLPTFIWGMLRKGVNPTINVSAMIQMTLTIGVSLVALRVTRYRR